MGKAERRSGSFNFSRRRGALPSIKSHGFSPGRKGCRCQAPERIISVYSNITVILGCFLYVVLSTVTRFPFSLKKSICIFGLLFSHPHGNGGSPGAPAHLLCSILLLVVPTSSPSYTAMLPPYSPRRPLPPPAPPNNNSVVALKIFHILLLPGT